MAKKTDRKKKKKGGFLVAVVLLGAVAGGAYFYQDTIAVMVADIPVLNQIFVVPEVGTDETVSREELVEQVDLLKVTNDKLTEQLITAETQIEQLEARVKVLADYESQYQAFVADKNAWDEEVAMQNAELFIDHYETIYPEQSAQIYQTLITERNITDEQKKYAAIISEMDKGQAAGVLVEMLQTDTQLVQTVFSVLNLEVQGDLLNEMSTQDATRIMKLISP